MLQKVTRLDSVPTAEETVLTTEVPTKESRLYTLLNRRDAFNMTNIRRALYTLAIVNISAI